MEYLKCLGAGLLAMVGAVVLFALAMMVALIGSWAFGLFLNLFGIQIVPATGPIIEKAIATMALVLWAFVALPSLGSLLRECDDLKKKVVSLERSEMFLKKEVEKLRQKLESEPTKTTDSTT